MKKLAKTIAELTATLDQLLGKLEGPNNGNVILTEEEIMAWLEQEPTFPKAIVYPTGVNRDNNPTRRKQNRIPLCLN